MSRFITILLLIFSVNATAQNAVIVNSSNTAEISNSDIKKLFLGKRNSFTSGSSATLATIETGNDVREKFNSGVLNKSEAQYTGYWAKLTFTGRATPPKEFASSQAVKEFVASNPDAIGVVDLADVDDSVRVVLEF